MRGDIHRHELQLRFREVDWADLTTDDVVYYMIKRHKRESAAYGPFTCGPAHTDPAKVDLINMQGVTLSLSKDKLTPLVLADPHIDATYERRRRNCGGKGSDRTAEGGE